MQDMEKEGIKFYWTLGRYDTVVIMDAPNEKAVMKANISVNDVVITETMTAIPRQEAHELIQ